jgi:hypothetical protein
MGFLNPWLPQTTSGISHSYPIGTGVDVSYNACHFVVPIETTHGTLDNYSTPWKSVTARHH